MPNCQMKEMEKDVEMKLRGTAKEREATWQWEWETREESKLLELRLHTEYKPI